MHVPLQDEGFNSGIDSCRSSTEFGGGLTDEVIWQLNTAVLTRRDGQI